MNKISPIKRNENLVLLSRDHHDGLLTVWKVRQGLKNGTPCSVITAFILHQNSVHLQPHFIAEEKWLFPTLNSKDGLRKIAEQQHEELRKFVEEFSAPANDQPESIETLHKRFEKFAALLDEHIRFEERVLFPHIEISLSEQELRNIGQQLTIGHEEKKASGWTDEFWVRVKS